MLLDGKLGQDVWLIDKSASGFTCSPVRVGFISSIEKVITSSHERAEDKIEITYTIEFYDEDGYEIRHPDQLFAKREEAMVEAEKEFRKMIILAEQGLQVLKTRLESIRLYTEEED